MEDGGTCRYINVESATAYWREAGCPNHTVDSCVDSCIQSNYPTCKLHGYYLDHDPDPDSIYMQLPCNTLPGKVNISLND